jgi:hypothetical protein
MKTITLAFIMLAFGFSAVAYAQQFTLLGSYDLAWPATEVIVEGDYAYLPDGDSGLIVLDVSDPENPLLVGQGPPETRVEHIALSGNYIYGSRDFYHPLPDSTQFKIIDVSDPASPFVVGEFILIGRIKDIDTLGSYVYALNNYGNEMNIIDVSDPHNPHLASSFDPIGLVSKLQITGSTAYIITMTHGLRIIDLTDPLNPAQIGYCYTPGISYDLFVKGYYAYIADGADLTIIDVSSPSSPSIIQDTTQIHCDGNITVYEDLIFMGAYLDTMAKFLVAVDVRDLSDPQLICSYPIPLFIYVGKPVVRNNYLFVPRYGYETKLLIFDAAVTGIEDDLNKPEFFASLKNYPNPFNDRCIIEYTIPEETSVEIIIYNILGQKAEILFEGIKQPGAYTLRWEAGGNSSGVYFARLETGNYSKNIKMLLLK